MYLYNPVIPVYLSKFNLNEKLYVLSEYLTYLKSKDINDEYHKIRYINLDYANQIVIKKYSTIEM